MKYLAFVILGLLGLIAVLLLIALVRTLGIQPKTVSYKAEPDPERAMAYARKLSKMVQFETVSYIGVDRKERFEQFHLVLKELFPTVFGKLEVNSLDGNLLIRWKGESDTKPVILMGHQDVVPAEGEWLHGPFSGDIADGKVWGRGTADTKCSVMCILQTMEELLNEGYTPKYDVYLCSTCTEETGGDGAMKLVEELQRRGVKPYMLCDEGGAILEDPIGGVKGSFAMVGVLEKGIGNLKFTAHSNGGHASAPKRESPIARLAAFVADAEQHYPFRSVMGKEVCAMFEGFAPYAGFPLRYVMGNLWLFKPLLTKLMPKISAEAAAMLRTTLAFTMASGSAAYNVIPQEASIGANLRFIPHQDMEESIAVISARAAKYGLETEIVSACKACTPVDIGGEAFGLMRKAIEQTFPGLPVSPYVMTGGTDARFFDGICPNCFRFSPVAFGPEQMKGMHGLNETMTVACLPGAVDFYKAFIALNDAN